MKQVFEQHLQTNFPGLLQSKILVAVSGGLDSVYAKRKAKRMNTSSKIWLKSWM